MGALGQVLLSLATMAGLWSGAILAGFSYGGFWTLSPSMVAELFGTLHFATLYNFLSLAVSSGSLVFSSLIPSELYDWQATSHPATDGKGGCAGASCFRITNFVAIGAVCIGFCAAFLLHIRTRSAA